ncbi:uncharacterized protein LOC128663351 [Bombina bombina]|uniref:uncharacterized protein LOC128663351 n=1 Tax=Bombina bombina TaxID=8345 RepID=UPI00235B04C8|nr:uncharacterized protein LOC128663351 [Bombina bombina]XP_053573622.1 uncharacterized protein LOC128663351 [Bombina bombina]
MNQDFERHLLNLSKDQTREDPDLQTEWNEALTTCSLTLMDIVIRSKTKKRDNLKSKIDNITVDLKTLKSDTKYGEFKSNLKAKIQKTDGELALRKGNKFNRDMEDYLNNKVYNWSRFQNRPRRRSFRPQGGKKNQVSSAENIATANPKPILKHKSKRKVAFSSTDTSDQESYISDGSISSGPVGPRSLSPPSPPPSHSTISLSSSSKSILPPSCPLLSLQVLSDSDTDEEEDTAVCPKDKDKDTSAVPLGGAQGGQAEESRKSQRKSHKKDYRY